MPFMPKLKISYQRRSFISFISLDYLRQKEGKHNRRAKREKIAINIFGSAKFNLVLQNQNKKNHHDTGE